ncbi:Card1-like endonuclease domain-containing protein [Rhodoflexus caldus]|uniref:Card1-like endonuclease domain-containing protein n=1 Tax=Rhodoflexus caldus TaxID=2891236 RepID=UPI002029D0EB|nr:DUF1887 family CARF protein [Rhodoflexus caldus]
MPTASVLLISAETLPNVLFIKEFPAERHVFITTAKMEQEKRSEWIMRAAGIAPQKVQRITVNQDDFGSILQSLENAGLQPSADWQVNITGGNKLMSIAAFDFFARHEAAIFYLAVDNKHFQKLFPDSSLYPINYQVSLSEYLAAHGRVFKSMANPKLQDPLHLQESVTIMKECRRVNGIVGESLMLKEKINTTKNLAEQQVFYTGQWFELYVYQTIKQHLKLSDAKIALSAALYPIDSDEEIQMNHNKDNDIDVCFVRNNYFYIMECKVYTSQTKAKNLQQSKGVSSIHSHLYKLAAIKQPLGLNAKAFLITPNNLTANPTSFEAIKKRCELLRINKPVDYQTLQTEQTFQKFLLEKF